MFYIITLILIIYLIIINRLTAIIKQTWKFIPELTFSLLQNRKLNYYWSSFLVKMLMTHSQLKLIIGICIDFVLSYYLQSSHHYITLIKLVLYLIFKVDQIESNDMAIFRLLIIEIWLNEQCCARLSDDSDSRKIIKIENGLWGKSNFSITIIRNCSEFKLANKILDYIIHLIKFLL